MELRTLVNLAGEPPLGAPPLPPPGAPHAVYCAAAVPDARRVFVHVGCAPRLARSHTNVV